MMKKHVFLFNKGSRAAVYGIGTYIRQMTLCLKSMEGISLHLVQLNSDVEKVELSCKDGYDELNIPRSFLAIGNKTIRYYQNAWCLIRLYFPITVDKPVFFLLNYTSHHVLIPEMRAVFPYCRIFFTVHYQEWCFVLNGDVSLLQKITSVSDRNILDSEELEVYESFLREKKIYDQVDKIICLSHFTEELLWKEYEIPKNKTVLIYNGMKDETADYLLENRDRLKAKFGFEANEKIILYVGRLDLIKGIGLLIKSFRSLLEIEHNCRLLLVGDGNFVRYLNDCDEIWERVIFTGRLEKKRLFQLYRIADVGVLPSMHEQCSYTVIEMMMFDVPVIASSSSGLKEMIDENQNGLLFEMKNEDDLVGIIHLKNQLRRILFESTSKGKQFHPKLTYIRKYSLDKMGKQYANLFE